VLPDLTYLERYEDASPAPSVGHAVFGLRQPVVEPLHDGKSTGDVLIRLAGEIGEPVATAFAFKDFWDAIKKRVIGLHKAARGSIVEEKGATFLERLREEGFWSDEPYVYERWEESLATPTGRSRVLLFIDPGFDLGARERARHHAGGSARRARIGASAIGSACPATSSPAPGDPSRHPFVLLPYRPSTYAEGSGANQPWLQELHLHVGRPTWTTEAEMHPETAQQADVHDGEKIEVASDTGRIEVVAHVSKGVLPGYVRIAQGGGHAALGRFASGWGANVMDLVSVGETEARAGISQLQGTRVSVRKVGSS
jgi:anaerobic selenocysteine-containing dehydrogenase